MTKLILIEDNFFTREQMKIYLTAKGFDVMEAGDFTSAWSLIKTNSKSLEVAVIDMARKHMLSPIKLSRHKIQILLVTNQSELTCRKIYYPYG